MAIQLGDVLGDYQVTGILGRGGMGKVFRVRSLLTDREEAMKVLLPDFDENPELEDRFLREIKTHARLQHPNIASLRTAVRIGDRLFMLMELVEGASLADRLREGPLSVDASLDCMSQVLSALAYAHDAGVIHRDIKPANILLAHDGTVKLTDFGIARSSDATTRLTSTGHSVGTLAYMSPEQVRADVVDARSDLYSLGLTLYEMVTGRRAIQGDTAHSLMNAQLSVMPSEPAVVNPMVPRWISVAIMRALAKAPEQRFQSAAAFKAALVEDQTRVVTPIRRPLATPPASGPSVSGGYGSGSTTTAAASEPGPTVTGPGLLTPASTTPGFNTPSVAKPGVTGTVSGPVPPSSFDAATLDRLTQALAPYLGPISKVLVNRAAKRVASLHELQEALAAEISGPEDRRRFLTRVRSTL
jgi:eukaryotic-like serine/threonine-protein kinase